MMKNNVVGRSNYVKEETLLKLKKGIFKILYHRVSNLQSSHHFT